MTNKDWIQCALMAAIMGLLAPLAIPLAGGVPISLATCIVMLCGSLLGWKKGAWSVLIYLLLGCIGIPVFAGYTAGIGHILGLSGGFLIGYLILVFVVGKCNQTVSRLIVGMIIGNVCLYAFGILWFLIVSQSTIMAALIWCVLPFIPGDVCKMVVVAILSPILWKSLPFLNRNFTRV
ncbi:biotin transporter BioY [Absicoccus porci]|uniref:biotin transporter BioY n=1 Tax=Absicoccus porci TaxID=2486576 RepID=UPI003F8BE4A6